MPAGSNIRRIRIPPVSARRFSLFLGAVIGVVTIQQYLRHGYNNYSIFVSSLKLLLAHQSLYAPHPELYSDTYKYSPTFAVFMAPFTWQPALTGLLCWSLVNGFAYSDWTNVRDMFDPVRKASMMRVWARYVNPDVNPRWISSWLAAAAGPVRAPECLARFCLPPAPAVLAARCAGDLQRRGRTAHLHHCDDWLRDLVRLRTDPESRGSDCHAGDHARGVADLH